jgi:hypothetical protein
VLLALEFSVFYICGAELAPVFGLTSVQHSTSKQRYVRLTVDFQYSDMVMCRVTTFSAAADCGAGDGS